MTAGAALLLSVGCGKQVELSPVSGVVTDGDKPLNEVMIYFMPDPGTPGGMSRAITDEQGRFTLTYTGDEGGTGAVVGLHVVTMEDLASENFRGSGPPPTPRIPPAMMQVGGTPLKFEIGEGDQTIEIDISKYDS